MEKNLVTIFPVPNLPQQILFLPTYSQIHYPLPFQMAGLIAEKSVKTQEIQHS